MKALLLALIATTAFGQAAPPPASTAGNQTITGNKTFTGDIYTTQGKKLSFNGSTATKYLSSDGTSLTCTGLDMIAGASGAANMYASGFGLNVGLTPATFGMTQGANELYLSVQTGKTIYLRSNGVVRATVTDNGLAIGTTGTAIASSLATTSVIDFASTSNTTLDSSNITLTGATAGAACIVGAPAAAAVAGASFTCYVSAADTVKVRLTAVGAGIDPASGTFTVRVFQ